MAQLDDTVLQVRLGLEISDPAIELIRNRKKLIVRRQDTDKCRIVCPDLCDIGVLPRTQFGMAIACCSGGRTDEKERGEDVEKHLDLRSPNEDLPGPVGAEEHENGLGGEEGIKEEELLTLWTEARPSKWG